MFNAPVYYKDTVTSTMDVSRKLASDGAVHGTVVVAEFQENGRGRIQGRKWETQCGKSLLFTVLLRYPRTEDIPVALTLRTGLAVAKAIEEFEPLLKDRIIIKWPNDILIRENLNHEPNEQDFRFKKIAGILCEADGGIVHIGIGINVAQREFSTELETKATSIALASGRDIIPENRSVLLKMILSNIYEEFLDTNYTNNWKQRLEQRLYKIKEEVIFIEGPADSGKEIKGILTGISDTGELLIDSRAYNTGELVYNSCN